MDKGPIDRVERAASRAERPEKIRLGELLLELRLISPEQLKIVLEQHLKSGKKVGRLLVENGFITGLHLAEEIDELAEGGLVVADALRERLAVEQSVRGHSVSP